MIQHDFKILKRLKAWWCRMKLAKWQGKITKLTHYFDNNPLQGTGLYLQDYSHFVGQEIPCYHGIVHLLVQMEFSQKGLSCDHCFRFLITLLHIPIELFKMGIIKKEETPLGIMYTWQKWKWIQNFGRQTSRKQITWEI